MAQQIEIRHAEPEDYRALRDIRTGSRVVWGTLQVPFPSAERWRKRLAEERDNIYLLVASVDGAPVGDLGLYLETRSPRRRHAAGVGLCVHDAWQGKGVGSALLRAAIGLADDWLNIVRLELTVFADNTPAIGLYEKFGFETEGRHRGYAFRDGALADAYSMARLNPRHRYDAS